jgi:hypothetical protein
MTYCCPEATATFLSADFLAWWNCFTHHACTSTYQTNCPVNAPQPGYTFCGPYSAIATDYDCCKTLQPAGAALDDALVACLQRNCVGTCL